MKKFKTAVTPLRSGSSGNAIHICANDTNLLIDAGVSGRAIAQSLCEINSDPGQLDAILVTHEHSDHVAGVGVLMRRHRLPLYVNEKTWQAMREQIGPVQESQVFIFETGETIEIGNLAVSSFLIPHDAAEPVGFRIRSDHGDITVMTDLGNVPGQLLAQAAGSQIVLIEANYDREMLLTGSYPDHLKRRVDSSIGHLSNDDCAQAVSNLLQCGTRHFILSHLSAENNIPQLALETVGRLLNQKEARPSADTTITVASRYCVTRSVCL